MNIEAHIIKWLDSLDLGFQVYGDVPTQHTEEFVLVKRIGGRRDNVVIDRPRIALQLWAKSNIRCAELAYKVDEYIADLALDSRISKAIRTELYSLEPSDSGHARYQVEIDLVCMT